MKAPQHPLNSAFDKANDPLSAWREQQKAALTNEQWQEFDHIKQEEKKKQEAKARELERTRLQRAEEEKRKQLLRHKKFDILATKSMKEKRAADLASRIIQAQDAKTLDSLACQGTEREDNYLRKAEQDRQKQVHRKASPQAEKTPSKENSLTAAFEKAAKQRAQQEQSRQQSRGGRSLAPAFNKASRPH